MSTNLHQYNTQDAINP